LTALLQGYIEKQETVERAAFEKFFVYSYAWAMGGLFETEDREKFQKFLENRQAPLPQGTTAGRPGVEKETVYDYYVDPETK